MPVFGRWKPHGERWHRSVSECGQFYVSVKEPAENDLCRQWFVALCRSSGVVIESAHTDHRLLPRRGLMSSRTAKRWAKQWALKSSEQLHEQG